MHSYSISSSDLGSQVTLVLDGEIRTASDKHPNFLNIVQACVTNKMEGIEELFDVHAAINRRFERVSDRITISDGVFYYENVEMRGRLPDKIVDFYQRGLDFQPLALFAEKLALNPEDNSRNQLYEYLERHDFVVTPEGDFLSYKGVNEDYTSIHAGYGIVNGVEYFDTHLDNSIGNVVELPRDKVDNNTFVACSTGLHAGAYEYANSFGYRTVLVSVNPRDVVSVPNDLSFQKLRVARYVVLEDVTEELNEKERTNTYARYYDEDDNYEDEDDNYYYYDEYAHYSEEDDNHNDDEDAEFFEDIIDFLEALDYTTRGYSRKGKIADNYSHAAEKFDVEPSSDLVTSYLDDALVTRALYRYQVEDAISYYESQL